MHLLRDIEIIEDLEYFEQCFKATREFLSSLPEFHNNNNEFIGIEVVYVKFYVKTWNNQKVRSYEFKHWTNYIRKSIKRDLLNYYRFLQRRKKQREEFEKNYPTEASDTNRHNEIVPEIDLNTLIDSLPKRAKEVAINHYYNGLSITECADEMNRSYDNVLKGKNLALKLLRKALLSMLI